MVPDLHSPIPREGEVDSFERYHFFSSVDNDSDNVNYAPTHNGQPLTATKLISNYLPSNTVDLNTSPNGLTPKGAFWPPLKAIPLASYYKLHRVPSLTAMMEPNRNGTHEIELPRSEPVPPIPEPQEKVPQNGIHNKILEQVVRTPGRQPSPQPTHLSVPGGSQHRVLHEEGSGYVAPKFEGKELQMDQGKCPLSQGKGDRETD